MKTLISFFVLAIHLNAFGVEEDPKIARAQRALMTCLANTESFSTAAPGCLLLFYSLADSVDSYLYSRGRRPEFCSQNGDDFIPIHLMGSGQPSCVDTETFQKMLALTATIRAENQRLRR